MSFFIYPQNFNACHVHFGPATQTHQTNECQDNKLYRMIYSTNHISLNHMGFIMHFIPIKTAHSPYSNKWFMHYDVNHPTNSSIITHLCGIECSIIDKFTRSVLGESRQCIHSIAEHLNSGCIKAHSRHHDDDDHASSDHGGATHDEMPDTTACDNWGNHGNLQIIVTIYGVWETRTQCGLVYKLTKW